MSDKKLTKKELEELVKELEAQIKELEDQLEGVDTIEDIAEEIKPVSNVQMLWNLRNAFVNKGGSSDVKAGANYSVKLIEIYKRVFGDDSSPA